MIIAPFSSFTNTLPVWALCLLFVTGVIAVAQFGLSVFNRWFAHSKLTQNNEVPGIMFGAISLIYSLILAFVIVAVWEDYEDLNKTIEAETDKMNGIIAHSSTMPDSVRKPVYGALYKYCDRVLENEWHMNGDSLDNQASAVPCLRLMLLTLQPQDELQRNVYGVIDENLNQITELRRNRLSHNRSQIPGLVWLILESGTVMLVVFSYFFDVSSLKLKRIYLSFFSGCLGMCLFLVSALDHPFDAYMHLSKAPYISIQLALKKDNSIICN